MGDRGAAGPPPNDVELPLLAVLVVRGLLDDAVERVAQGHVRRSDLRAATAALRARGESGAADLLDLVGRSSDAAALVLGPLSRFDLAWRAGLFAAIVLALISPWLLIPAVAVATYVPIRWKRRTRNRLDAEELALLDGWWRSRRERTRLREDQRWIPLGFAALAFVVAGISLANGGWASGLVLTAVAGVCVVWWHRARRPLAGDGPGPIARGAIPTTAIGTHGPLTTPQRQTRTDAAGGLPPDILPFAVSRPRPALALFATVYLAGGALLLLIQGSSAARPWAVIPAVLAALVRWRSSQTELVLDRAGVSDRGLVRTRTFPWTEVSELRIVADGEQRARLELITPGAVHTVWAGPSDAQVVAVGPAVGTVMARGPLAHPGSGRLLGLLVTTTLVLIGGMATIVALAAAVDGPAAPVDPATLPPGTEVVSYYDTQLEAWGTPRLPCPSPLGSIAGDVPPACREELRGQSIAAIIAAVIAVGAWGALVAIAVRHRRGRGDPLP